MCVVVASGMGIAAKGCLSSNPAPDEQLVSRMEDICQIARKNIKTPNDGVTKLGAYLADHAGDMYKHLVDTVALVVQITDDDKLEARGKLARKRWSDAAEACYSDWTDFADAIERDPAASQRMNRFGQRLERTIDVMFGDSSLRDLPRAFERYLSTSLVRSSR